MDTIIDIYKDILQGKRRVFPNSTWKPFEYGDNNFKSCIRYLTLDKLKLQRHEIASIDQQFLKKYRLWGGVTKLYAGKTEAIKNAFEDFTFNDWEFFGHRFTSETAREAMCYSIKKYNLNKEQVIRAKGKIINEPTFNRAYDWGRLQYSGLLNMYNALLPDLKITYLDLPRSVLHKDKDIISLIKTIFEKELFWTEKDIVENMSLVIAQKHFKKIYRKFGNITEMVKLAYPNISYLSGVKRTITKAQFEAISSDLSEGISYKYVVKD